MQQPPPDNVAMQLLERLEQMVQLQAQSNAHFEELRKSHEDYQKRSAATIETLERRVKALEERKGLPLEPSDTDTKKLKRNRALTAEQTVINLPICMGVLV